MLVSSRAELSFSGILTHASATLPVETLNPREGAWMGLRRSLNSIIYKSMYMCLLYWGKGSEF